MMGHSKKPKSSKEHTKDKKESVKQKLRDKKKQSKKNKHRARLIIRNLPFTVLEDDLQTHFGHYGEIDEIKILKREDGQMMGCAFVQFKLVQSAAKARHYVNGKPFLNREIECDWAVPKNKYKNAKAGEVEIKQEPMDEGYDRNEIKDEPKEDSESIVKQLEVSDNVNLDEVDVKSEESDKDEIGVRQESSQHIKDETDSDDKDDSDDDTIDAEIDEDFKEDKKDIPRLKVQSNDTVEGKTIFIKNVPFAATNTDIKECFSKFGPLYYALVCMDPLTEHSKGTAFVKFRNKEDADKCLESTNITLMDNVLEIQTAVARSELNRKSTDKSSEKNKDTRNLYLVKEGVILAGSKAAEGISASDMAKRLQLEQYKTHMLRNLNMIVARTRLVVHNIPQNWDDAKLRALFQKHSRPKVIIKEARIMRNMRILDAKGVGKSKEFGFVTFTAHEAALEALRAINNNPTIFSTNKRPIVAFSIENRARLQAKEKRLHNSRIRNPKCKSYDPKAVIAKPKIESIKNTVEPEGEKSEFAGVSATPGVKKMRSRFNIKTQAKLHHEQLKKEKKNKKYAKKTLKEKQAEFTKQPRQKINKNKMKEKDHFSKLVNQYKAQLFGSTSENKEKNQKKKWFL